VIPVLRNMFNYRYMSRRKCLQQLTNVITYEEMLRKNSVSFEGANEKLRGEISLLLTAPYEHANLRINFENITPIPYEHAKLLKYEEISRR